MKNKIVNARKYLNERTLIEKAIIHIGLFPLTFLFLLLTSPYNEKEEMKKPLLMLLIISFLFCGCSDFTSPLTAISEPLQEVDFSFDLLSHSNSFSPTLFCNIQISNIAELPITFWLLTIEVRTDKGTLITGTLWDDDLLLNPSQTYLAEGIPLTIRPSCVNEGKVCAIISTVGESVQSWKVIGKYSESN